MNDLRKRTATAPVLFGAAYSVYTRIARLALVEKGVGHRFEEVDVFAPGGPPDDYRRHRQPFGRIPAFEHDGFRLYETGAIARYIDEAFDGPPLQPSAPKPRARMTQIIGILDSYAYRTLVWDIFVERVDAPRKDRAPDEARIAKALPLADTICRVLAGFLADAPFLAGPAATLADLHAAPMFAYARMAPEAAGLIERHARLARWWDAVSARPAMAATRFPLETQDPSV